MITQLQSLIRDSDLSLRIIAQRAGVPEITVSRILHGRVDPKLSTLEKIARVFGRELVLQPGSQS